jgi:cellulose 1,4-beta-cellobiosidase
MILADNGSNWFISGVPDPRWDDTLLHTLSYVAGSNFEVVQMGDVITDLVGVPTNLQAVAGNAAVALSWTASAGATGYNVKRATVSGGPYTTIAHLPATNYFDKSVSNATTYYYVVSGVCKTGQSTDSAEVSATPSSTVVTVRSLVLSPSTVTGGASSQGTVTLSGKAPSGGIVVTLTSGRPTVATVPAGVTVPAGQRSATFSVTTSNVTTSTRVAIVAMAPVTTKSARATLTVAP